MFESGMREANEKIIPIVSRTYEVFSTMLYFLYSGIAKNGISADVAIDLILLCHEHEIMTLANWCERTILRAILYPPINFEEVVYVYQTVCNVYGDSLKQLRKACQRIFISNIETIKKKTIF